MTGSVQPARFYSRLLALQIASIEAGLQPYAGRADGKAGRAPDRVGAISEVAEVQ